MSWAGQEGLRELPIVMKKLVNWLTKKFSDISHLSPYDQYLDLMHGVQLRPTSWLTLTNWSRDALTRVNCYWWAMISVTFNDGTESVKSLDRDNSHGPPWSCWCLCVVKHDSSFAAMLTSTKDIFSMHPFQSLIKLNFLLCQKDLIWPVELHFFGCHGSRLVAMETNTVRSSPGWEPTLLSSLMAISLLTGIQNNPFLVTMAANWLPWKPKDY